MRAAEKADLSTCPFYCQRESILGLSLIGETICPRVQSNCIERICGCGHISEIEPEAVLPEDLSDIFTESEIGSSRIGRVGELLAWVWELGVRKLLVHIDQRVEVLGQASDLDCGSKLLSYQVRGNLEEVELDSFLRGRE